MRKVEVVSWNGEWVSRFKEEAQLLRQIFGDQLIEIYHIGSTSVPGLQAKPIIDIMIAVKSILEVDNLNQELEKNCYEVKGENGIPGRRYFQKGGDKRSHHVHVFQVDSPEIKRHVAFRDFLCEYPEEARKYGELKQQLAARLPCDIESYIKGKGSLVADIEAKALEWQRQCGGQY